MNLYCLFCSQRCHVLAFDSDWWHCVPCKVRYRGQSSPIIWSQVGHDSLYDGLYEIEFERKIKDKTYVLCLEIQGNRTRIYKRIDCKTASGFDTSIDTNLISIKPVLNGVTPENAESKIKTLLVFS